MATTPIQNPNERPPVSLLTGVFGSSRGIAPLPASGGAMTSSEVPVGSADALRDARVDFDALGVALAPVTRTLNPSLSLPGFGSVTFWLGLSLATTLPLPSPAVRR